jgi:hypothetical protein
MKTYQVEARINGEWIPIGLVQTTIAAAKHIAGMQPGMYDIRIIETVTTIFWERGA